jgi:hypothetical protein
MRIYVRTRGWPRELDYEFLGQPPEVSWWRGYDGVTDLEQPTILLESDGRSWRCYVSGLSSQRRDSVGRPVRIDLALAGECGPADFDDQQIALAVIGTSIDGLARVHGEFVPGDPLDPWLSEQNVEEMMRNPGGKTAARAASAVRDAYREARVARRGERSHSIQQWLGGLAQPESRDEFMMLAEQLVHGRSGRALMLNLITADKDVAGLADAGGTLGILASRSSTLSGMPVRALATSRPHLPRWLRWLAGWFPRWPRRLGRS